MRSYEAALDRARASLRRLGIPSALPALHAIGIGISRDVLGGSHSVAIYPPIDSLMPLERGLAETIACGGETSLYVHIAFCETRCTFCHYTVDHYSGRSRATARDNSNVARYLAALNRELAYWGAKFARAGTVVSSVYIGGGTPLVLDEVALRGVIYAIQNEFDVRDAAEICVEGSPLTITAPDGEDKLRSLKEHGVTRLSFGVQSFDDEVLKYAARGYRRETPVQACAIASRIFENWNIDLIQGLYKGSTTEIWGNLAAIADIIPPHLTWYHGRFADRPQGHWSRTDARQAGFEDELATLVGRMLIWQEMATLGYGQTDGNRFVRAHQYTDPFKKIRTSASSNLLGVGAGAYSHIGARTVKGNGSGLVFRNESNIRTYVDAALQGVAPVRTGRTVDEEEVLAASYATGLRTGRVEDDYLRVLRAAHPQLSAYYDALVEELRAGGALEAYVCGDGGAGLRLSPLGRLFEDETLSLFFSPAVKSTLSMKPTRERHRQHA